MVNDRGQWNRGGRRGGGDPPFKINVPGISANDAAIFFQRELIRREFGDEGVKRFDEELLKRAKSAQGVNDA
jgi:hypothetical protein